MAKFVNILLVVVLLTFISDGGIIGKVEGKQCSVDVGFNICTSSHDRCLKLCIQATFYLIYKASCQIANDGSTYCECIFNCIDVDNNTNNQLMVAKSPSPLM
ncbi:PREDICTED: uncharacterized protein LOC109234953 [Nicotiana attenuata]|uniref:Defensin-like protein n=1 Tax=Nicotiana attenuata TaxID=49451 RepID=A0A1J6HWB4_NICAT|nr:PREDICTED: uncharacterized protein LOC109234953 [Nicotiana attenuata]OIS96611.1 hypothetical protein A4A49_14031 [Nicotiana attenuata]